MFNLPPDPLLSPSASLPDGAAGTGAGGDEAPGAPAGFGSGGCWLVINCGKADDADPTLPTDMMRLPLEGRFEERPGPPPQIPERTLIPHDRSEPVGIAQNDVF